MIGDKKTLVSTLSGCPHCYNTGEMVEIEGVVTAEGYGCTDYAWHCRKCGKDWKEENCNDGFSTHDEDGIEDWENDEREC